MEDLANLLAVKLPELLEEGSRQARVFTPIARLEDYINDFELYSPGEEEAAEEQGEPRALRELGQQEERRRALVRALGRVSKVSIRYSFHQSDRGASHRVLARAL